MKWGIIPTGQKELGTRVFVDHMEHLADLINDNRDIVAKNKLAAAANPEENRRMEVRAKFFETTIRIREIAQSGKYAGLELDAEIAKTIFAFLKDPELRRSIAELAKEPSISAQTREILSDDILPREEEQRGFLWSYTDPKKDRANPGKREGYFEHFITKVTGSKDSEAGSL